MSYRTIAKRYTCWQQVLAVALHFMYTARSQLALCNIQSLLIFSLWNRMLRVSITYTPQLWWENLGRKGSNQEKQDMQCAYIVTFMGVRATIFAAEKQ